MNNRTNFNTALEYAEYSKEQQRLKELQQAKEQEQLRYNQEMKNIAKNALTESRKSNEIARQGLNVAKDSRKLSCWAIFIAIVSIVVAILLRIV